MNLNDIASGLTSVVNPSTMLTIKINTGNVVKPDGSQVPSYDTIMIAGDVQPLSTTDLQHLQGLNIEGIKRAIYLNGAFNALSRINRKGGDLVIDPSGSTWLTVMVMEQWPDWCKLAVTLQNQKQLAR